MSKFLVVGAGATGTGVVERLASEGHEVVVVTRSGSGPALDGVQRVAADASGGEALTALATGTRAIFNCANPPYHRWATDWPPIAAALLDAAERSGATLVTLGNLYPYGVPSGPMTPHDPCLATYEKAQVRARMWADALGRHRQGRLRAVEVRASDFIGPGADSMLGDRVLPRILRGKAVRVLGNPDAPHSWTYVGDVATTLVACALDETAWGRLWHVPTNPPRSSRQAVDDLADAAGVPHVRVSAIPASLLRAAGIFSPMARELPKTLYQFQVPFVIDDLETREHFVLEPTPWPAVLGEAVRPRRGSKGGTAGSVATAGAAPGPHRD